MRQARGINQEGTGKLVLTSTNTYRGLTDIRIGTLSINNASALETTDCGTFLSGFSSTLELQGSITVFGESLSLTNGSLVGVDGDNVWQGPVTLAGSREIGVLAGTLTISGVIGGSGGVVGSSAAASKLVLTNGTPTEKHVFPPGSNAEGAAYSPLSAWHVPG